ncbi:MAG: ribosome-associated translation inhibitor RaiA [Alphaproteobacteria bacterium]|nr:ribosome-associated translation inhibitor RaiA [Alphaproteobacteria bacterium]
MQVVIQGKQLSLGDALKEHIEEKISEIKDKYFNRLTDAAVTISPEGSAFFKCHIALHVGKDIKVQGTAEETDPYAAFDAAAAKVAKQLRKYKTKLRDHHNKHETSAEVESIKARDYVLAAQLLDSSHDEKAEEKDEPVVIAEMTTDIVTLTVSEAVMRMDLSDQPVLLFRNAGNKGLNLVYRRPDGNIGWIDPQLDKLNGTK